MPWAGLPFKISLNLVYHSHVACPIFSTAFDMGRRQQMPLSQKMVTIVAFSGYPQLRAFVSLHLDPVCVKTPVRRRLHARYACDITPLPPRAALWSCAPDRIVTVRSRPKHNLGDDFRDAPSRAGLRAGPGTTGGNDGF